MQAVHNQPLRARIHCILQSVVHLKRFNSFFSFLVLVLIVLIGVLRVVSTYGVFNQTYDEPATIATGMEWLDRGSYELEKDHPPLARIATALGLYIDGLRLHRTDDIWEAGNEILGSRDSYSRNLSLARFGILPFFILSTVLIWAWTRKVSSEGTAIIAALLYSSLPPILAHTGFATTDLAVSTTIFGAVFVFVTWLRLPNLRWSVILGVMLALAFLSKFSSLVFLPACIVALVLVHVIFKNGQRKETARIGWSWISSGAITVATCVFVMWSAYKFSFGPPLTATYRSHGDLINKVVGTRGALHAAFYTVMEFPFFPAPEYVQGLFHFAHHATAGHRSYLLGEVRDSGWWYFFPIALIVKTPIPFLILAAIGFVVFLWRFVATKRIDILAPFLCAGVILIISIPSRINIGVRHILPIYPFLAILASLGVWYLWNLRKARSVGRWVVAFLTLWHVVLPFSWHPDYIAYFNETIRRPEHVLINSDLDWGQDLFRLREELRRRGVSEVALAYHGSADLSQHNMPRIRPLKAHRPTTGWIAISLRLLKDDFTDEPPYNGYSWLERHAPVANVGHSIRLYYVPDDPKTTAESFSRGSRGTSLN